MSGPYSLVVASDLPTKSGDLLRRSNQQFNVYYKLDLLEIQERSLVSLALSESYRIIQWVKSQSRVIYSLLN